MDFVYFSFFQGVLAFFAPCAVALLPGYIASYVSRNSSETEKLTPKLVSGLKLAVYSIIGILVVYSVAGILIVVASQILKVYMKWVTMGMGGLLIVLGGMMLLGKNVALSFHFSTPTTTSEIKEAFFFGLAYAIGALGCLFPLFLIVATQAISAPTLWIGSSYLLAYFTGISLMMIGIIVLSTFAREFLMKYLRKLLPYMDRITGILLIFAGVYIIYYQTVLL